MSIGIGVSLEEQNAMSDAQFYANERGSEIVLRQVSSESAMERDIYGSIKKRNPTRIVLHAHPIVYSPTDRQLEKAGIRDKVDVLVTIATKDLTDRGIKYKDIDPLRWEVGMGSEDAETTPTAYESDGLYTIKALNRKNKFSHVFLNIVFGLVKK